MAITFKVLIASIGVLFFAAGFAVSTYALTPIYPPCGVICADAFDVCVTSGGKTPEQCQIEYMACILDCT